MQTPKHQTYYHSLCSTRLQQTAEDAVAEIWGAPGCIPSLACLAIECPLVADSSHFVEVWAAPTRPSDSQDHSASPAPHPLPQTPTSPAFIFFLSSPSRQFNQVHRLTPNHPPLTTPLSSPLYSGLCICMPGTLCGGLGSRAQILLYLSSPHFCASLFADKVSLPIEKRTKPEVTFSEVKCPHLRHVVYKVNHTMSTMKNLSNSVLELRH